MSELESVVSPSQPTENDEVHEFKEVPSVGAEIEDV